ncbi:MAG: amino acid permease [Gemmatimonadaceae bacterium]|nr:amino acid permease [Gemmatimonadaceae bacterium]
MAGYIKSIAQLHVEAGRGVLRRTLGPVHLTALGVGSIIGTGIFVLTGTAAARHAGPALVLSMIIAAVACALAGLCYAELAAMIPVAGSAYTYAYATVGEVMAWIIGWDLMLEYALSASTVAVGWSGYFVSLMRDLGWHLSPALTAPLGAAVPLAGGATATGVFNLPAALIVLAVSALLVVGIKESASANAALVIVKIAVLIVFVAAGAAYVSRDNLTPFLPPNSGTFGEFGWSGVMRGAGVIFFAFIGFDAVSTAAQEARQPQRDMPIGILASLVICTILYIAVAIVLTGIVRFDRLDVADPLAVGIDATGMRWLSPFIKVSALFGLFSTMMVQLIGQTRIFYAMSRDGLLPPLFSRVHPTFRTPHVSTALVGGAIAIAAGLLPLQLLGQLVSMGTQLAFVLACIGILVLRRRAPEVPRPFRTPGMPWVPIAGALACFVQMVSLPWATWIRLFTWLALGMVVYWAYGRRQAQRQRAAMAGAAPARYADPGRTGDAPPPHG